jgi:GntR family transcriptional regulator
VSEPEPPINPDGAELIYVQVAGRLAARIERGYWSPGARLPAERDLAAEFGVSYDSVRRAMAVLRERGLVVSVHGRGTFVTAR